MAAGRSKHWNALGEKQRALDFYQQALPLQRAGGDRRGEADTLTNIGFIHFQAGELTQAATILEQVIQVYRDVRAAPSLAIALSNRAVVLERLNRLDEAIAHVEESLALLQQFNLPQDAAGATLAQHQQFLDRLKRQRDGRGCAARGAIRWRWGMKPLRREKLDTAVPCPYPNRRVLVGTRRCRVRRIRRDFRE